MEQQKEVTTLGGWRVEERREEDKEQGVRRGMREKGRGERIQERWETDLLWSVVERPRLPDATLTAITSVVTTVRSADSAT